MIMQWSDKKYESWVNLLNLTDFINVKKKRIIILTGLKVDFLRFHITNIRINKSYCVSDPVTKHVSVNLSVSHIQGGI